MSDRNIDVLIAAVGAFFLGGVYLGGVIAAGLVFGSFVAVVLALVGAGLGYLAQVLSLLVADGSKIPLGLWLVSVLSSIAAGITILLGGFG